MIHLKAKKRKFIAINERLNFNFPNNMEERYWPKDRCDHKGNIYMFFRVLTPPQPKHLNVKFVYLNTKKSFVHNESIEYYFSKSIRNIPTKFTGTKAWVTLTPLIQDRNILWKILFNVKFRKDQKQCTIFYELGDPDIVNLKKGEKQF